MEISIEIRALTTMSEMIDAVALQKIYWGDDQESLVPAHMLYSIASYGGHVLAAFDGKRMAGMLMGFLGTDMNTVGARPAMANLLIMSKRMVVLPEYRGKGIGYRLKLAQRDFAMKQGVRLVTWTFDPLLSRNAYLNIAKLGGMCRRYVNDYFSGQTTHPTLTADRLVVEWWVTQRRVEERLHGNRSVLTLAQYLSANTQIVNQARHSKDDLPAPVDMLITPTHSMALVEIPLDFPALEQKDAALATQWRTHIRRVFNHLLHSGYIVTDFLRADYEGYRRSFYLLSFDGRVESRLN